MSLVGNPTGIYAYGSYPSDPYIGMCIFDSTYGKVLYYYGPVVGWQSDWNVEWGLVAEVVANTNYTLTQTETDIPGLSLYFNPYKNRRYLVTMTVLLSAVAETSGSDISLADANNNVHKFEALEIANPSQNRTRMLVLTERYLAPDYNTVFRKGRAYKIESANIKTANAPMTIRAYDKGSYGPPLYA
jgi:hypothetical protein